MRVDDLVFVASSSQLNDVISESKQCVILKVSTPFRSSDAWAYFGAKYLRQNAPSGGNVHVTTRCELAGERPRI